MFRLAHLFALTSTALALTFTSPSADSTVDLTSPLIITWTSSSSDPSSINIAIVNTVQGSSATPQTLASNVATSSGHITIPANTISNYGDGFELVATSPDSGAQIASSGQFSLADGVYSVETASNGVLTIATSTTSTEAAPTAAAATTATGASEASTTGAAASGATTTATNGGSAATISVFGSSTSASSSQTSTGSASTSTSSGGNLGFGSSGASASLQRGSGLLVSISCAAMFTLGALFVLV